MMVLGQILGLSGHLTPISVQQSLPALSIHYRSYVSDWESLGIQTISRFQSANACGIGLAISCFVKSVSATIGLHLISVYLDIDKALFASAKNYDEVYHIWHNKIEPNTVPNASIILTAFSLEQEDNCYLQIIPYKQDTWFLKRWKG